MSHFTVLVVGENIEEQLAPYSEELEVTPYKKYLDEKEIKMMAESYKLQENDLLSLAARMNDWNGDPGSIDNRGLYCLSTYNPKSKWDWYTIGGRWLGFFILRKGREEFGALGEPGAFKNKPNGNADQAMKKDIDWEAMSVRNKFEAEETWSEYSAKVYEITKLILTEEEQEKRILQEKFMFGISKNDTRESFVKRQILCSTFAILNNGEWIEQAEMGWWGVVHDRKMEENKWAEYWTDFVANLPNDSLLTVVDCHI